MQVLYSEHMSESRGHDEVSSTLECPFRVT